MSVFLALAFPLTTGAGPMDAALRATEAPDTFRAAFTVEMSSDIATRKYRFDPRKEIGVRWALIAAEGEDSALDEAGAAWGAEAAPDGRLFPDDLRDSLGDIVEVEDLGGAWRLRFQHAPSANDTGLDVWATQRLAAAAWMEPVQGRIVRIDYTLPSPVRGPRGGRLTKLEQSYLLETEPEWGFSYVSQYQLKFEAKAGFRTMRQNYTAIISDATFFFANRDAEDAYVSVQTPEARLAAK